MRVGASYTLHWTKSAKISMSILLAARPQPQYSCQHKRLTLHLGWLTCPTVASKKLGIVGNCALMLTALMAATLRGDRSHGLCSQCVSPTCNSEGLTSARQSVGTRVLVSVISVVYCFEDICGPGSQNVQISDLTGIIMTSR